MYTSPFFKKCLGWDSSFISTSYDSYALSMQPLEYPRKVNAMNQPSNFR